MVRALRLACAALLLALASSCSHSTSPEKGTSVQAGPVRGGTLRVSIRSEPGTFNRYVRAGQTSTTDAITQLTQASLVRINRATDQLEPWLAESWTSSADGRVFTLKLRPGTTFSDGVPFTSADVVFSFRVLYDPAVNSVLAAGISVQGKPLAVSAPDPATVVITLPAPFAPGLRLLDGLPILPRHQLEAALDAHTFADAWNLQTPPGSMAGLGPFVITGYVPGQQVTLSRNPHYWRHDASGAPLPYLDSIVMDVVSSQDAEMLRLEAGTVDVMSQADLRPEDLSAVRRLHAQGALTLDDVGVGVDPNLLWFNLTAARAAKHDRPYLQRAEFRQAISCAVDRDAIARSVYLGAAVPIYGYVTPGNRTWYSASAPTYPHDLDRARRLLASIGLEDRNHDGTLEDAAGRPVRFSIITQRANTREKIATVIQEQLRQVGIGVDVVALDFPSLFQRFGSGDYDAMFYGFQASAMDPANNLDFWLSSGSAHVWNPGQASPATPWERQIDDLMRQQVAAPTLAERQRLFAEVQRIFGENLPAITFVAPRVFVATTSRVKGAVPVLLDPKILWNSDTLFVTGPPR